MRGSEIDDVANLETSPLEESQAMRGLPESFIYKANELSDDFLFG